MRPVKVCHGFLRSTLTTNGEYRRPPASLPDHSGEVMTARGWTWVSANVMWSFARSSARSASRTPVRSSRAFQPWMANGPLAIQGWKALEERTGVRLADLAEERANDHITFADTQVQPRAVITSPEWSGSEAGGRRYSPFVVNVERKKPWHTFTGRMHFFLDLSLIHI